MITFFWARRSSCACAKRVTFCTVLQVLGIHVCNCFEGEREGVGGGGEEERKGENDTEEFQAGFIYGDRRVFLGLVGKWVTRGWRRMKIVYDWMGRDIRWKIVNEEWWQLMKDSFFDFVF